MTSPTNKEEDSNIALAVAQPVEITRDEALRSLLSNEDLSDLKLRGSDGTLVIANRCLLASRSPVFGRMLFGQFAEASEKIIDIGYEGAILQAIVEYIYTDTVDTLEEMEDKDEDQWDVSVVQFLVTLVEAAGYFALPGLCELVEDVVEEVVKMNSDVSTLFLASCDPECEPSKNLQNIALEVVKRNPRILIDGSKPSIGLIHPLHIEEILKADNLPMSETSCFQLLQLWAIAGAGENETANEEENSTKKSRKRIAAQEMTNLIDLADINTTELSTTVTTSGLVTTEQLFDAYKEKAVRAEKRRRTSYEQWRGEPVWKSSRTNVFEHDLPETCRTEMLDCPILKSGVHKWSIKILRGTLMLGVASTRWPIDSGLDLTVQEGAWAIFVTNLTLVVGHNNEYQHGRLPTYAEGSIVSFTLDLDGGGILTVSIDNNAAVQLFSDMCQDHGEGHGFVPAVSIGDGSVEFLGLEEIS